MKGMIDNHPKEEKEAKLMIEKILKGKNNQKRNSMNQFMIDRTGDFLISNHLFQGINSGENEVIFAQNNPVVMKQDSFGFHESLIKIEKNQTNHIANIGPKDKTSGSLGLTLMEFSKMSDNQDKEPEEPDF